MARTRRFTNGYYVNALVKRAGAWVIASNAVVPRAPWRSPLFARRRHVRRRVVPRVPFGAYLETWDVVHDNAPR
jgi:hypothetical protein